MMMLGAMWMMAAAMVGFMLGRMSMYGQMEEVGLAGTGESRRVYADAHVYAGGRGHGGVGGYDGAEECASTKGCDGTEECVAAGEYASVGVYAGGDAHAEETAGTRGSVPGRGRVSSGGNAPVGGTVSARAGEGRRGLARRGKAHRAEERVFWSVGSPVSGVVTARREGERAVALIYPEGDFLYAPVAGKVTKLFPMGNAFRLATESGEELHLRVGDVGDDLLGRYYRPRVVQNEFVAKGKVLLEFDREGLEAEGIPAEVAVWVEGCAHGGIRVVADGERARIGEEILQVVE